VEETDSESVEELVEEGQNFEADAVAGIEDADASQAEVRTKQVLEDDVPREYLENDLDRLNRKSPGPGKRMGEFRGEQMGQKNAKRADRGGRR